MPSTIAALLLLLVSEGAGQHQLFLQPHPYIITGQNAIYDQQILPPMQQPTGEYNAYQFRPQEPMGGLLQQTGQPATYQFSHQAFGDFQQYQQPTEYQFGQQAVGNVQQYQPPTTPANFKFGQHTVGDAQQYQPPTDYQFGQQADGNGRRYQPTTEPATYQFGQQAIGDAQQKQAPAEPLPSREAIEQQRDAYIQESEANARTAIQRLDDEVAIAKDKFVAEQEVARHKHFLELDELLGTRKQEAVAATETYVARVQRQAEDLIKRTVIQQCLDDSKGKTDVIANEENLCKQELEQQIRAAYDASRQGSTLSDPSSAISEARGRFDRQMQELAEKRRAVQLEFHC